MTESQAPRPGDPRAGALARQAGVRLAFHRVPVPGLAGPLRLVALADIHAGGPQMPMRRVAAAVECARALEGDVVVHLGDYLADHRFLTSKPEIEALAALLAGLEAPVGRAAVMGNHDWYADPAAQARGQGPVTAHRALEAAGIPALENAALRLEAPAGPLWLAGLGAQLTHRPADRRNPGEGGADDLPATLAALTDDAPAILLAHEPDIFPQVPDRFALTLSGHTHAGQINLFGWRPAVPSRYGARYAHGHIIEAGRHLVVSAGLGCSGLPIRFLCPPEIVVVELRPTG